MSTKPQQTAEINALPFAGYILLERWVTGNKWDEDVTTSALLALGQVNRNHALLLIVFIAVWEV